MNIIQALDDPKLLGGAIRDPATFLAWRTLLKAVFGVPMTPAEADVFRSCTGLAEAPAAPFAILWLVIGRRGGKSYFMAIVAVYLAIFRDWRRFLSPGERAVVLIVAADREQAKILRRYVGGLLQNPLFKAHVENETAESIELRNSVAVEVATCSFRSVRGRSVCACLLDETAFWRSESTANPDTEVWRAIRASMAQFGSESVAIIASSPYARKGLLYEGYRRFFGRFDAQNLVWQAATKVMNPTISDDFLAREHENDPVAAASEYGAEFRSDVEAFVASEVVAAAVDQGVFERAPLRGVRYSAFVDPSGGAKDSMTMAIGHVEDRVAIIDAVRERKPPFSPDGVVEDFAALLKTYGVNTVKGDRYAGEWPRERFLVHGIMYEAAARPKSDLYRDLLPVLNSARVRLVDLPKLAAQITSLERRTARGGRDSIDHVAGGHDDVANAVAGLVSMLIGTGESDGVPVAETGRYSTGGGGSVGVANWIDRLSPERAVELGLCSRERAIKNGWIQ